MIKINLTPAEELENKFWYILDILCLGGIIFLASYGSELFLDNQRNEVQDIRRQTEELVKNTNRLAPELERHKETTEKIQRSQNQLASLQNLVQSPIVRYQTLILLEHMQTLKPRGLWFKAMHDDSQTKTLYLAGGAYDGMIIAEFMTNLQTTQSEITDMSDLRSQIYFPWVELESVTQGKTTATSTPQTAAAPTNEETPEEKAKAAEEKKISQAFEKTQDPLLSKDISVTGDAFDTIFPNLQNAPSFAMKIKYGERIIKEIELNL